MTLEQLIQRAQDIRGYASAQANIHALRALTAPTVPTVPTAPTDKEQK